MVANAQRVQDIFLAAIEVSDPTERSVFLDRECATDLELRHRVEALLQADQDPASILKAPALGLSEIPSDDTVGLEPAADSPSPSVTQPNSAARPGDDLLAFLTPSTKPGHLGRLGHYEILEVIGKGGFGTVLKAFDEKLHRVVAIKVLSPAFAANGSARKRFIREAQTAAAVKNEHVVAIHGVEDEAQPPYLVMEIIDGISLQDKIDKQGPLSVKEILRIGLQTAEGLAAAHKQGLVHRDIKPANILLENGVERVKITDFGLARAVDDASVTQSGVVAGTPMYMSPEQAEGLPVDHRSDLFSLGTVLYAMCTGHSPFRASGTHAVLKRVIDASPRPIGEINSEIPDWLCGIIAKLHAKKPEERFQTAKEVAELLGQRLADVQAGRVVAGEPSRVSDRVEASPTDSAAPLLRRWPAAIPIVAAVTITAGLLVVALVFAWRNWPGPDLPTQKTETNSQFVPVFGGPGWKERYDSASWSSTGDFTAAGAQFQLWPDCQLDTKEKLPRDFHLRMEVMLSSGEGTIRLRAKPRVLGPDTPRPNDGWFLLFEAYDGVSVDCTLDLKDGANSKHSSPKIARRGDWFYLEIISKEGNTDILVNGKKTIAIQGPNAAPVAGILSLWNSGQIGRPGGSDSAIAFKRIEYKDLTPAENTPGSELRWAQLFNGKDLTGWAWMPLVEDSWHVEAGTLVSHGAKPKSWLVTKRGDFRNFHLRLEMKSSAKAYNFVTFRMRDDDSYYQAGHRCDQPGTGLSYTFGASGAGLKPGQSSQLAELPEVPAGTWFAIDLVADGPNVTYKINGKPFAQFEGLTVRPGHIGLSVNGPVPGTVVAYRKIEIKELPLEPPPAPEPGWVPLFNGKDLSGWDGGKDAWKADASGSLVFKGPKQEPLSTKRSFSDFFLRFDYKYLEQFPKTTLPFLKIELRTQATRDDERVHPLLQFVPRGKNVVPELGPVKALPGGTMTVSLSPSVQKTQKFPDKEFEPLTWNAVEIRCVKDTMEAFSNGIAIAKTHAGESLTGPIVLQPINAGMAFRNIQIKELPPAK